MSAPWWRGWSAPRPRSSPARPSAPTGDRSCTDSPRRRHHASPLLQRSPMLRLPQPVRTPRQPRYVTAAVLATIALVAAACGSSGGSASGPSAPALAISASHTVNLAFGADMQVPDPDIFYEIEGNAVVTSVHEGLVKYANGASTIVPAVASSWTVAPDGKTYTFHLRPGLTFHDGTPINSAAAAFDFKRRTGVNPAPAYMLAAVVSPDSPDPLTFVVHLDKPVSAFLDYLAAPYGPKLVSPTAVKAHETGTSTAHPDGDWAQQWLKTHDAGTGAYQNCA